MKRNFKAATIAGVALMLVGQVAAMAQAPAPAPAAPGPPTAPHNRVNGTVTAVDTTANTITVHDRRSDSDEVVAVNGDTKYSKIANVGLAALSVGTIISIASREQADATATSIDGARINVLKELPKPRPTGAGAPEGGAGGFNYNPPVVGTIATLTPSLTITTPAGTTLTVNTTTETQVLAPQPAALTDVAVGQRVQVEGSSDGTTFTAKEVSIQPARQRRAAPPAN